MSGAHKSYKNRWLAGFGPQAIVFQPLLIEPKLTSYQLEKETYLKGPGPFSNIREQIMNMVLRGNTLAIGIVNMVEIIVGRGENKLLPGPRLAF